MSDHAVRRGPGRAPAGESDGRQALLDAGLQVFAELGYAAARTRDILKVAGATAPTLYHHFGGKAPLYLAVVDDVFDRIVRAFTEATDGRGPFLERLDGILDATTAFQGSDRAAASLVLAAPIEIRRHAELAGGRASTRRLLDVVAATCADATDLSQPPEIAARAVMTVVDGLARPAAALDPAAFAAVVESVRMLARGSLAAGG